MAVNHTIRCTKTAPYRRLIRVAFNRSSNLVRDSPMIDKVVFGMFLHIADTYTVCALYREDALLLRTVAVGGDVRNAGSSSASSRSVAITGGSHQGSC